MRACSPRSTRPCAGSPLPSRRRVLLSDTVGFIRNLPTTLVEAFRATLEEVAEAGLVLHVVDASSPHASAHVAHVHKVLHEIGAEGIPQVLVLNKIDRGEIHLEPSRLEARSVAISALTGEGIDGLMKAVDEVTAVRPDSARPLSLSRGRRRRARPAARRGPRSGHPLRRTLLRSGGRRPRVPQAPSRKMDDFLRVCGKRCGKLSRQRTKPRIKRYLQRNEPGRSNSCKAVAA